MKEKSKRHINYLTNKRIQMLILLIQKPKFKIIKVYLFIKPGLTTKKKMKKKENHCTRTFKIKFRTYLFTEIFSFASCSSADPYETSITSVIFNPRRSQFFKCDKPLQNRKSNIQVVYKNANFFKTLSCRK